MFRIRAAVVGDLRAVLAREAAIGAAAVTLAVRETGEALRAEYRAQIGRAGMGRRLANTWRISRFPPRGDSLGAAALVHSRAPDIIAAYDAGVTILPRSGRFLAIPTSFNRQSGRRGGKPRITPEQMIAMRGQAFIVPRSDGPGFLWMLKVTRAERMQRGRVRQLAFAGGAVEVGRGRVGRTRAILDAGAVPMFTLVEQVTLERRLDVDRPVRQFGDRLPAAIVAAWERLDRQGAGGRLGAGVRRR